MKIYNKFKLYHRNTEHSFTLIETVVSLAIISFVVIEIASIQGNGIYFSSYNLKQSQATWLAKRVMSQVEYYFNHYPFDELEVERTQVPFEDFKDFKYSLSIKEWKLNFLDLLTASANPQEGTTNSPTSELMKAAIEQVLGKSLLKVAYVEVFWPEGAVQNSVSLTYLLTNQKKVDEVLMGFKPLYDKLDTTKPGQSQSQGSQGAQQVSP